MNAPGAVQAVASRDVDALGEILSELRRIRQLLEQQQRPSAMADAGPARLLSALAASMGDLDLPFDAAEVINHAAVDDGLADSLQACSVRTVAALGAVLRSWRDRPVDGLVLRRDGRSWRLERT
jgi:hypothetical protein